jgi:hypothetical protein
MEAAPLASSLVRGLCFAYVRPIRQLTTARVHCSALPDGDCAAERRAVLEHFLEQWLADRAEVFRAKQENWDRDAAEAEATE